MPGESRVGVHHPSLEAEGRAAVVQPVVRGEPAPAAHRAPVRRRESSGGSLVPLTLLVVLLLVVSSSAAGSAFDLRSSTSGATPSGQPLLPGLAGPVHNAARGTPYVAEHAIEFTGPTAATQLNYTGSPYGLSPIFWGTTVSPRAELYPDEGELLNATPTQLIVWPGASAGDLYDPLHDLIYSGNGGRGHTPLTSEAQFVAWCRSIHCRAIFQVPGEIDDPGYAATLVRYTEVNLSFVPEFWEIGNEPERWNNWKLPWSQQSFSNRLSITPLEYAWEVRNYTIALRAVDPSIHIIGLPGTGRNNGPWSLAQWVNATLVVNAPNLAGIAFHDYPAATNRNLSLSKFYSTITSKSGLPNRVGSVRQSIAAELAIVCPSCAPIPVMVTEVASALSHYGFAPYSAGFPGALDMAAQMTQAIDLNLSNSDLFATVFNTSNSWFNLSDSPRPDYVTYAEILDHLGSEAYPVNLSGFNDTLFGVGTLAPSSDDRSDLLVVNLNLTTGAVFRPTLPSYPPGSPVEVWYWNGTLGPETVNGRNITTAMAETPGPVAEFFPRGLPTNWTLPPQSLVLFESYAVPSAPVELTETGLPVGTFWFAGVAPAQGWATANTSRETLLEPIGPLTLKIPMFQVSKVERFVPEGATPDLLTVPCQVPAGGTTIGVSYLTQWALNITSASSVGGLVEPSPTWWDSGAPLRLEAQPAVGQVLAHWTTVEHLGSSVTITNVTDPGTSMTVWPNGSMAIHASFRAGFPVVFSETGLPSGSEWSVSVHWNFTDTENVSSEDSGVSNLELNERTVASSDGQAAETNLLVFAEANGTYGYSVDPVEGYRSLPVGANFTVRGGTVYETVAFLPAPRYPLRFVETGLPNGTFWSVTLPNASHGAPMTVRSNTSSLFVGDVEPGHFGFTVTTVADYRARPPSDGFNLTAPGLTVEVLFAPVLYAVVWEESGLGPNLSWAVRVGPSLVPSSGAWTTAHLMNGSYAFEVPNAGGYVANTTTGLLTVRGGEVVIPISFLRPAFAVTFSVSGAVPGLTWSVRLANSTAASGAAILGFSEPNGSYTFNVTPPRGFLIDPSHGVVTVNGSSALVGLTLLSLSPPPGPPLWTLASAALTAAAVLALTILGTLWVVGALRRRRPGAPL